jgi:hypothetical protein
MIPIELPAWVELVAYAFLGLMALEILVRIWQILSNKKTNKNLNEKLDMLQEDVDQIQAKVGLSFLYLKTYYEQPDDEDRYDTDQIGRVN